MNETSFKWWEDRRLKYNFGLIKAGIGAFICYILVFEVFKHKMSPEDEITLFTIFFQGIAYLLAMLFANLCYFMGVLSEKMVRPRNTERFRNRVYGLGYWFSVSLPFFIPAIVLIMGIIK